MANFSSRCFLFLHLTLTTSVFFGCSSPNNETVTVETSALIPRSTQEIDDPVADGWSTEQLSSRAQSALKQRIDSALHAVPTTHETRSSYASTALLERDLQRITTRVGIDVDRWRSDSSESSTSHPPLVDVICARAQSAANDSHVHQKIKVTGIDALNETQPLEFSTNVRVELYRKSQADSFQSTTKMRCRWTSQGDDVQLIEAHLVAYEEAHLESSAGVWFEEITPSVMRDSTAYQEQLLYNDDHWAQRIERRLGANFMGYHGIAVGDVNGDLLDDLYICQSGGIPNILYLQQPDGSVLECPDAGLNLLDSTRAALFVDLDNDGDQDVVVASITGTLLYENVGDVKFEFRERQRRSSRGYSLAAADYDGDGDLDIYACCYHAPPDAEYPNPVPYQDARNGSPNVLIANDGGWQFHDATREAGLEADNDRWSYAACFDDFDQDGDPDLYVANDFGRNCLYLNEDGTFSNRAEQLGVEDIASGMSAAWGDYNRDGRNDIYVGNMFSSAGGRVTYQRKFKSDAAGETKSQLQRLARGNSLFEAQPNGTFRDVTMTANVAMGRWSWSSNFVDINNDGWLDLLIANGNYTGGDSGDL